MYVIECLQLSFENQYEQTRIQLMSYEMLARVQKTPHIAFEQDYRLVMQSLICVMQSLVMVVFDQYEQKRNLLIGGQNHIISTDTKQQTDFISIEINEALDQVYKKIRRQ